MGMNSYNYNLSTVKYTYQANLYDTNEAAVLQEEGQCPEFAVN